MCKDAPQVLEDFGFEFGGFGFGLLGELQWVVVFEAEERGGRRVREVVSWSGGGYLAGYTPAVEF